MTDDEAHHDPRALQATIERLTRELGEVEARYGLMSLAFAKAQQELDLARTTVEMNHMACQTAEDALAKARRERDYAVRWANKAVGDVKEQCFRERDEALAAVAKAQQERDEAQLSLSSQTATSQALALQLAKAREALTIFADDENWRYGRRLDPNGSRFDGTEIARAALAPAKPETGGEV